MSFWPFLYGGHLEENVIGKEVYYAGTVRASPAKREAGDNENK